jgi:DNA polymerase-3 subunit delta'
MSFKSDHALSLLRRSVTQGRLAHAYLITGPKEADLEGFAVRFLNDIDGTRFGSMEAVRDSGVPLLTPESKSRRIRVGDDSSDTNTMRWFLHQMMLAPAQGRRKLGIILAADRMMAEAQNAFLKTLEEPPPGTLLVLLSEHPDRLLETTLSRVIRIPLMAEQARRLSEPETRLVRLLSDLAGRNSDSLAAAMSLRKEFEDILETVHDRLKKQFESAFEEEKKHYKQTTDVDNAWLKEREAEADAAIESRYRQERDALMELLLAWMGDVLRHQVGVDRLDLPEYANATRALAARWDAAVVSRRLKELRRLHSNLHTNVQEGLALEAAFIAAFA